MPNANLTLVAVLAALSLAACNRTEARYAAVDFGESREAVLKVEKDMAEALLAKDAAKLTSHYAGDAILAVPGRPMVKGADAIARVNSEDLSDPNFRFDFKNQQTDVADSGDLAFTRGRYDVTWTDPKTNQPVSAAGTYVTVFRKQEDGKWKAIAHITSPSG